MAGALPPGGGLASPGGGMASGGGMSPGAWMATGGGTITHPKERNRASSVMFPVLSEASSPVGMVAQDNDAAVPEQPET
jgi:hypothetical protein